ncbi:hypothetical protein [Halorarum salinum]|uniref:Uncharacterized protein n=1 Tax=Halorarum salinum TaxID=2743089 RepID=A0A7D5QIN9_9EURY|nr:hypothetical protein [Halobaculum salinum]QLG60845.1 hypothetical protein HUG12_03420 [Halobaculum salinum]
MGEDLQSGGEPEFLGQCSDCGHVYTIQELEDGELRPVGTDGTCTCGNDGFVIHPAE